MREDERKKVREGRVFYNRRQPHRRAKIIRVYTSDAGNEMVVYKVMDHRNQIAWSRDPWSEPKSNLRSLFEAHFGYDESASENRLLDEREAEDVLSVAKRQVLGEMGIPADDEDSEYLLNIFIKAVRHHAATQIRAHNDVSCCEGNAGYCSADTPAEISRTIDQPLTRDELAHLDIRGN